MEIKKSSIPTNTVTRTLTDIDAPTGNIYESVVVIARRAHQQCTRGRSALRPGNGGHPH